MSDSDACKDYAIVVVGSAGTVAGCCWDCDDGIAESFACVVDWLFDWCGDYFVEYAEVKYAVVEFELNCIDVSGVVD